MVYHSIIQYMIGSQVQLIVGQALRQEIINENGKENIMLNVMDKISEPGCIVYCPTVVSVLDGEYPISSRLNILILWQFGAVSKKCTNFFSQLNNQLQLI
ncbi:MAG: hypothetical protein CVV64_16270 [Candidatus Wallbacteria bacterium HGW-Wallbacteria-1]|uniref:Uncharacterized protein n=1 Tax=Candidatus Wallbacteria bacterium HGW-Wallbacteria-1 TaxID=2013854 RepID=A0A2N1PL25_9BACT|nr:MAG: hypothetical protein CVV64_16270 [Candidatus Wallbacteria bacterium HGW-Wallbacteria-1]